MPNAFARCDVMDVTLACIRVGKNYATRVCARIVVMDEKFVLLTFALNAKMWVEKNEKKNFARDASGCCGCGTEYVPSAE